MKAAVLHNFGELPRYEDFPDPISEKDWIEIKVKAVALENVDKDMAAGKHFASLQFLPILPAIVGFDGVGVAEDGRLVSFRGMKAPYGAMAEKAVVPAANVQPIPDWTDAITASAVPASALTSLIPLKWGAMLQPGETVLINGATGVSGRLAVQIARLLGAGRVIGTGRNDKSLKQILNEGVDTVIDLKRSDEEISTDFKRLAGSGYDIILDYLWGHPTDVLISALAPNELSFPQKKVRFVQIGDKAGATISLPAAAFRTSGLEIFGSGAAITPEAIVGGFQQVWEWIKTNQIHMEIERVWLKDIETVWKRRDFQGKRIVVIPS